MSKIRVSCPACQGLFELDAEFRGEEVDCPRCQVPFQIPMSGERGIPVPEQDEVREETVIDMSCPYCRTSFALPREYRGELAECVECRKLFLIPMTGNVGEPADDEDLPPSEVPGPGTKIQHDGASSRTSGIRSGTGGGSPGKKTATVVLSRDEIVGDLNDLGKRAPRPAPAASGGKSPASSSVTSGGTSSTPSPAPVASPAASGEKSPVPSSPSSAPRRLKPSIPIRRVSGVAGSDAEMEEADENSDSAAESADPDAHAKALAALYEPPDPGIASAPVVDISQAGRKQDTLHDIPPMDLHGHELAGRLPFWVPSLDLAKKEHLIYVEEGAEPACGKHYVLTGIPVLLTPLAVIAAAVSDVHPAIWASIGFLISLICWGTYISRFIPRLYRRVLILTNERAIMADSSEVVEVDLPRSGDVRKPAS